MIKYLSLQLPLVYGMLKALIWNSLALMVIDSCMSITRAEPRVAFRSNNNVPYFRNSSGGDIQAINWSRR